MITLFRKVTLISVILLSSTPLYAQTYTVERVIDGKTLKLTNGETVRLIGIEIPEDPQMGQEATTATKNILYGGVGRKVALAFDVQKKDKYGRLLAYMTLPWLGGAMPEIDGVVAKQDDTGIWIFLNAYLVKLGYATPMTMPPNVKYADLFEELYEGARENKRGLWQDEQVKESDIVLCEHDEDCIVVKYHHCCGSSKKAINKKHLKLYREHPEWQVYDDENQCAVIGMCVPDDHVTKAICADGSQPKHCSLVY